VRRVLLILSAAVAGLAVVVAVPIAGAVPARSNAGSTEATGSSTASPAAVHVHPSIGGPRTAFAVTVRIPAQTGTFVGFRRSDSLTVSGPSRRGCVARTEMALPAGAAGSTVRVRVTPGHPSGHWCTGTFHGVVTETQTITCGGDPQLACPMIMIRPQTIGRFRFAVRRG
jgi:hypothetical protein